MGSTSFTIKGRGESANEVFNDLVEEAISEYGHDPYNGTISTVTGFSDATNKFKSSGKSLPEYISDRLDDMGKRECEAICIKPPVKDERKNKVKVEHIVTPGTKKWLLKYTVYASTRNVKSFDTKGDAVEFAKKWAETYKENIEIHMEKVLEKGNTIVAKLNFVRPTKPTDGEWMFYGCAAE